MRAATKTLVSLLGPALILLVGAWWLMVIALLLPIFPMSRAIHDTLEVTQHSEYEHP